MITIRQSFLNDFKSLMVHDWGTEAEILDAIKGKPHPVQWYAHAGTAWHQALGNERPKETIYVQLDGDKTEIRLKYGDYTFRLDDIMRGMEHVGEGFWEVPGSKMYDIDGELVRVTGTADHIAGGIISDNKTKFTPPDPSSYQDSLQWRLYLDIHGGLCFRYNLFDFRKNKDGFCDLDEIYSFKMWPYPGMSDECRHWVREFVAWAKWRGAIHYLNQKERAA